MPKVKSYVVEKYLNSKEIKNIIGHFIPESHYTMLIDHDADVFYYDKLSKTKKMLLQFRKKAIKHELINRANDVFEKHVKSSSSMRGVAGGFIDKNKLSSNVKDVVSHNKFKSKVIYKDDTISNYYVSNKVNSLIAGYFDKPTLNTKHDNIKKNLIPCRKTAFTNKNWNKWNSIIPLLKKADSLYKKYQPETHYEQLNLAKNVPDYQIDDTAFSTVTVNYNWRTACHIDSGDYSQGYSILLVSENGTYGGGYLGFPQFKICVDVRNGDFLLFDPHQYHCNTEFFDTQPDWSRLSLVIYYRQNIQNCKQFGSGRHKIKIKLKNPEKIKIKKNDHNYEMIDYKNHKRQIKLMLLIRPNTTDSKVIKEVIDSNCYEKQKLNFFVGSNDRWLDLGANIGIFSLLALSRGCHVYSCEPEPDNLFLLEENLKNNFPKNKWKIIPYVISHIRKPTIELHLCKSDVNKYRHTIYKKRGRSTISVKNMHILELLNDVKIDCIKIDIEGAEIDILETLKPSDYKNNGIKKLVFEYSFDVDNYIPRFLAIIDNLREYFDIVHYTKVKPDQLRYTYFPAATLVYCIKREGKS